MIPVLVALLFSLFAHAEKLPVPATNELTKSSCRQYSPLFLCGEYDARASNDGNANWVKRLQENCDGDSECTGQEAQSCRRHCHRVLHDARARVCGRCTVTAFITEPSAPSLPDPTGVDVAKPTSATPASAKPPKTAAPSQRENPAAKSPCESESDCLTRTRDTHRAAEGTVHERRERYDRNASGARDTTASSITGAVRMLERLQASAVTNSTPVTRARLASDTKLVSRAEEVLLPTPKGAFTQSEAESANDPGIRQELIYAAQSAANANFFTEESVKAGKAETDFHELASEAGERAGGLASAGNGNYAAAPIRNAAPAVSGPVGANLTASSLGDAGAAGRSAIVLGNGAPGSVGSADTSLGAGANALHGAGSRSSTSDKIDLSGVRATQSLRDKLKRDLALKARADALDAAAFGAGGLKPLPLGASTGQAAAAAPAADALGETFRGMRGKAFGLGSSAEIAAEVRRLTREEDSSISSAESATLFERVRRAHKACQQRACVVGR